MRKAGELFYIFGDHLGSNSIVTNANGTKVSEMRYRAASLWDKAWGEVRYEGGASPTDYTYTGQYSYTADFGLMFYREASRSDSEVDNARWYDPGINHFTQPDTIVPDQYNPLDWNRYSYVRYNPLKYTDPTGHDPAACGPDGIWCGYDGSGYAGGTGSKGGGGNSNSGASGGGQACSGQYQSLMCAPVEDMPFILPNSPMIPLPDLSNQNFLYLHQPSLSNPTQDANEMVQIVRLGVDFNSIYELWEKAESYGRPKYKHVKYALPLGPIEYVFDAGLQLYDDRNKNLTVPQHALRVLVRGGESAIIDGFSIAAGLGTAAGTGGWGYFGGSYLFSGLSDSLVTNRLNPWLFNAPVFGGQP